MNDSLLFIGWLAQGGPTAIMQFVLGKVPKRDLIGVVKITEPMLVHRTLTMDPKTRQPVAFHERIVDPYWPVYRGFEMEFNLKNFTAWRVISEDHPKEGWIARQYQEALNESFAASAGLVTPGDSKKSPLSSVPS